METVDGHCNYLHKDMQLKEPDIASQKSKVGETNHANNVYAAEDALACFPALNLCKLHRLIHMNRDFADDALELCVLNEDWNKGGFNGFCGQILWLLPPDLMLFVRNWLKVKKSGHTE